jgi:hypothetical protein
VSTAFVHTVCRKLSFSLVRLPSIALERCKTWELVAKMREVLSGKAKRESGVSLLIEDGNSSLMGCTFTMSRLGLVGSRRQSFNVCPVKHKS